MSNIQFQVRRGTASQWLSADPVLASGEIGFETDTNKFKFGDGVKTWIQLDYVATGSGGGGGSSNTISAVNTTTVSTLYPVMVQNIGPQQAFVNLSSFKFDSVNGALGIGKQPDPAYKLDVLGNVYASGNVIASSDMRLKENVEEISDALKLVCDMRGVRFNRKESEVKMVGVIAQEMKEVVPEVVFESSNGFLGVDYGNLVGVLIEAIKELKKEVDILTVKVNEK